MAMVSGTDLEVAKTQTLKRNSGGSKSNQIRGNTQFIEYGAKGGQLMTYNEEFEVKRE